MKHLILNRIKKLNSGCWIWQGYLDKDGYGKLQINNKRDRAHRWSYKIFKKDVSKDILICHHCDNPSCVNPNHLFSGTQKDNMQDAVKKNRMSCGEKHFSKINPQLVSRGKKHSKIMKKVSAKGEKHCRAKLTEKQIKEIRRLCQFKGNKEISELFDVSRSLIEKIKYRKIWKHI